MFVDEAAALDAAATLAAVSPMARTAKGAVRQLVSVLREMVEQGVIPADLVELPPRKTREP